MLTDYQLIQPFLKTQYYTERKYIIMNNQNEYFKKFEPIFGSWTLGETLGEGSYGKVFKITREDFGRTYTAALKTISIPKSKAELDDILSDGFSKETATTYFRGVVDKLVDEFTLMSKLKGNSNIVSYEDHAVFRHEDGVGWDILIRMELLTPLNAFSKMINVTENDIINLGIDICRALELCGKHNIIHRDIKPENIFVSDNGDYKLGDFGIARQVEKTQSGLTKTGTPTYMAPEVYRNENYGASVDIYSLGIVLYKLLNHGRTPFLPNYPEEITYNAKEGALQKRLSGEEPIPAPTGTENRALADIVLKACSFNPADRFSSPFEMRKALEALVDNSKPRAVPVKEEKLDDTDKTVGIRRPDSISGSIPGANRTPTPASTPAPTPASTPAPAPASTPTPAPAPAPTPAPAPKKEKVKKEKTKKASKLPLIIIITVIVAAIAAGAAFFLFGSSSGNCGNALTWELSHDGTLTISGSGEMWNFTKDSRPWSGKEGKIKSVVLNYGVTTISQDAFYGLGNLKSVSFSETVTTIGDGAFYACTSLETLYLPSSLKQIGNDAFWKCTALREITFSDSLETIGDYAFCECTALGVVVIPKNVTSIGKYAFSKCTGLSQISFRNSSTSFGKNVFDGCNGNLELRASSGSTADKYAKANGHAFKAIVVKAK